MRALMILALMATPFAAIAGGFEDLAWLEGEWQGFAVAGERSNVTHVEYRYEQAGRYLVERTVAMFPPGEPSTEFETHQDMTVYYEIGGEVRAKGFFVEGFVQSSRVSVDGLTVVIESLEIEGGPPGMRTRMTYERAADSEDAYSGRFEIDWGDGELKCYHTYEFKRIR